MSAAPRKPRPAPKPGQVKVYRAMFNYSAQAKDELSFEEGETLYILDMSNTDWWMAKCGLRQGLIPSNYVEENAEHVEHPLHEAAKRGNLEFLQECIRNGVSVNGLDKSRSLPLHWAAHGGHIDCVEVLLKQAKTELNIQNKMGDTPLHSAAWKSHKEIVELLLNAGASLDKVNNDNKSPFDLAKDPETQRLLRRSVVLPSTFDEYAGGDDSD